MIVYLSCLFLYFYFILAILMVPQLMYRNMESLSLLYTSLFCCFNSTLFDKPHHLLQILVHSGLRDVGFLIPCHIIYTDCVVLPRNIIPCLQQGLLVFAACALSRYHRRQAEVDNSPTNPISVRTYETEIIKSLQSKISY